MTTSFISGRINDADGAVVGAAVIATHIPSETSYYSVSDKNGSYRLNSVAPGGPYAISVEMLGYRDTKFENIYAPLGETLTQNIELQPESIGLDAVVFTADATDSGRYQGYSLSTPDWKVMARLDWNINSNHRANLRFSHTKNYYSSSPSHIVRTGLAQYSLEASRF